MTDPRPKLPRLGLAVAALAFLVTAPASAEMRPTLSFSGATGLLDMPSGESQPDATASITSAHFGPLSRNTATFQITPRLSGSFRYSSTRNYDRILPSPRPTYFDRSFDLRYQLSFEGKYRPAVVVGLMDMIGTGQWSGEYVAATKTFGGNFKVTAGLGWGRLGSYGAIGAPLGARSTAPTRGGTVRLGQWFKGDMAPFAGVEWQVNDRLGLKAEYSSDAYLVETARGTFVRKSPFNFGVEYQASKSLRLGAHYMYGSEFGISAQFVLNPKSSPTGGILGNAPPLLIERPTHQSNAAAWSEAWVTDSATKTDLRAKVAKALGTQGITLESITLAAARAEVRIRVPKGENAAQVMGRTARVLTATLPASVERFEIVPLVNGLPLSKVALARSDLESLDNAADQDSLIFERAQISAGTGASADALHSPGLYPKFNWKFSPYLRTSYFDPDSPVRADLGVRLAATYDIAPGWVLSGSVTKKIAGNLNGSTRVSNSVLQHVRSDGNLYDAKGDPAIEHLTLAWYAKPGPNLYSRVTVGYLERMYGGISGELLWKPVNSRLALGAEINYVRQRDFDQLLGFQKYGVVTGHASAYYDFNNGFLGQLDVGRYLAGDIGATVSLDREFANGWKVGAFATLTNVSFDDFGEGSFDKGVRVEIPLSWLTGRKTEKVFATTLRPVTRDGGARLSVDGRLYNSVRSYDALRLDDQWGRFWR